MKKAIALLATLVVLTSTTFAQLAPSMSGYAETKWGTNLDLETDGFELDSEVTVTIPVVTSESVATEGEGATGSASITGSSLTFTFGLDSFNDDDGFLNEQLNDDGSGSGSGADSALKGTDAEISAKIDFGNGAYATIGSESDLAADFVAGDKDYWVSPAFDEDAGISLGYATDMMSLEVTVVNEADGYAAEEQDPSTDEGYVGSTDVIAEDRIVNVDEVGVDDVNPTTEDGYFLGAKAMYTAGDIFTLDFALATNSTGSLLADTAKKTAIAVKVVSKPVDGVTITVPFDYLTADAGTAMELMPSIAYVAGAITLGADFHYITVEQDLAATLAEDYVGTALNATLGYALDAGAFSLTVGSALGEMEADMDFSVALAWVAADYSVGIDLGDVMAMDDILMNLGYTGVAGVAVTVETALSLDDVEGDYTESFTLDNLNIDFTDALTGIENTTFTVNYSGWNTGDAKGTFYVGAKISL